MWWRENALARERDANTYTVKRQDLTETLSLSGEIDAKEKADIKFQTSGLLAWVGVKTGDTVKKYQAIATLDKRDLQNTFNKYMNDYLKERWDFEQDQKDNKDWQTRTMTDAARDTVKRTLEKSQFDLNKAVLDVEAKNLALKFATITAPFEGIITKVDVPMPGANITPAGAVFSLVNPKTLFFSATADQTEVVNFRSGQTGKIILESFPEIAMEAVVERISFVPKEGESSTVYELVMQMDYSQIGETNLKMGMTGDANFVLRERKDVLAVPEAYVKKEKDKYSVIKISDNGLSEKTEVVIGEAIDGQMEIKTGLNEGDKIYHQP